MILLTNDGTRDFLKNPIPVSVRKHWEVFGVHEGHFGLIIKDQKKPIYNKVPTLWVLPPNLAHGKTGDGTICEVSHFFTDQMPPIIEQLCQKDGYLEISLTQDKSLAYQKKHHELTQLFQSSEVLQPLRAQVLFHEILLLALEALPRHRLPQLKNPDQIRLEPAFLWYRDHMAEQPKLEAIARTVHLSESHFRRLVREQYSKSTKSLLMDIRMERATGLLRIANLSMEYIAKACGFSSHAAFTRAFKRHHRFTPHEWRQGVSINKD